MADFVLNNLEFLWLVAAALFGIVVDYIRLRLSISEIKSSIAAIKQDNKAAQKVASNQEKAINQLGVGFASFDGTLQAEINKILMEFSKAGK